jgi:hypothetical protein
MGHPLGNDASHIYLCGASFLIVQRILDSLKMATVTCYLISGSRVSFARGFDSVTLLFSNTPVSGV